MFNLEPNKNLRGSVKDQTVTPTKDVFGGTKDKDTILPLETADEIGEDDSQFDEFFDTEGTKERWDVLQKVLHEQGVLFPRAQRILQLQYRIGETVGEDNQPLKPRTLKEVTDLYNKENDDEYPLGEIIAIRKKAISKIRKYMRAQGLMKKFPPNNLGIE